MASALITVPPRCSAKASASADLPEAVGPVTTRTCLAMRAAVCLQHISFGCSAAERYMPGEHGARNNAFPDKRTASGSFCPEAALEPKGEEHPRPDRCARRQDRAARLGDPVEQPR